MKTIIENVILSGRFELSDILKKIDTLWVQGDLTDEDKDALVRLAQDKAVPENSYAPLQQQIDAIAAQLKDLKTTVESNAVGMAALKEAVEKLGGSVQPEEPVPEEYPAYKQPQGAHDAYYNGDTVTFEGDKYICIAPAGAACVWSPTVYPAYWEKVE